MHAPASPSSSPDSVEQHPAFSAACCTDGNDPQAGQWFKIALASLIAAQSMIFGLAINLTPPEGVTRVVMHSLLGVAAVAVYFLVGLPLTRSALRALSEGRVVVDQLFLLGILGAFALSVHSTVTGYGSVYYEVVAILLAIHTFGRVLAEQRRQKAGDGCERLRADLNLATVVLPDGTRAPRHASTLSVGDLVEVKPGSAIPVDGRVVEGEGYVQETALTGEPFPVVRRPGELVKAGAWSVDALFRVEALKPGAERAIDHFLDGVASALRFPSHIQQQADRIATWFLPSVLAVSLGTLAFWVWQANWTVAIFNALAVILVACPCALGLATPLGLWTAIHRLAALGIVARSGEVIEKLARARSVVLDKTGTLTEGRMRLARVDGIGGEEAIPELLAQAAAVERAFHHPVAEAFRDLDQGERVRCEKATLLAGLGVQGEVIDANGARHSLAIGNPRLATHFGRPEPEPVEGSLTPIHIYCDGDPAAVAWLEEIARPSAAETVKAFREAGLAVSLLSGDRSERVTEFSRLIGIEAAAGESAPETKLATIREMRERGEHPIFVGDGLNDAGAVAAADCGIALLDGAEVTVEAADAVLTHDNLAVLPEAVLTCRKLVEAIRQNILFAGAYNVIGMTLAACGLIHPVVAALLMLFASASVVGRALRFDAKVREGRWHPGQQTEGITLSLPRVRWREAGVMALAIGQGVALAWLGGFAAAQWGWFLAGGMAAGFVALQLLQRGAPGSRAGMATWMVLLGGPAMLLGWFFDAGWGPIVREGVCLCGCVKSDLGWGVALNFGWMHAGMLLSGFLVMGWCLRSRWEALGKAWMAALLLSVAAMMLGMELGALGMAPLPVGDGSAYFLLAYFAMMGGMTLAMMLACEWTRRWEKRMPIEPAAVASAG